MPDFFHSDSIRVGGAFILVATYAIIYTQYQKRKDAQKKNSPHVPKPTPKEKPEKEPYILAGVLAFILNFVIGYYYISLINDWDGFKFYEAFLRSLGIIISMVGLSVFPQIILYKNYIVPQLSGNKNSFIFLSVFIISIGLHFLICASPYIKQTNTQ